MRFVARLLIRDFRWAIAVSAITLICSAFVSLLGVISAASMSFITLRSGAKAGLRLFAFSTLVVFLFFLPLGGVNLRLLYICGELWVPALIMGYVLRGSERQADALIVVAIIVGLYAGTFRFMVGDVQQFWYSQFLLIWDSQLLPFLTQLQLLPFLTELYGSQEAGHDSIIRGLANQMHHVSMFMMFAFYSAVILLSRWWQSELFNLGGFGDEFKQIRMPRLCIYVAALVGLLVFLQTVMGSQSGMAIDVFVIFSLLFAFQGLSVVHFRARAIGLARGWMIAFYSLGFFFPKLSGLILATTGVADAFADFRRAKD